MRRGGVALVAVLGISLAVIVVLLVRHRLLPEDPVAAVHAKAEERAGNEPAASGEVEPAGRDERARSAVPAEGGEVPPPVARERPRDEAAPRTTRPPAPAEAAPQAPSDASAAQRSGPGAESAGPAAPAPVRAVSPVEGTRPAPVGAGTDRATGQETTPPGSHADDATSEDPESEPPVDPDPSQDRNPPALDQLQFVPPEVADGGTSTLSIRTSDDLSGVASVRGVVTSPSGAAFRPFQAQSDGSSNGAFAVNIEIPSKAESGNWYVSSLVILDRASNPLVGSYTAANAPQGGTLRVTSADSDSTAPEVLGIWLEKPNLSGGERNPIRVEVRDDRSGVAAVKGSFGSPSSNALAAFQCRAGATEGSWEGEVSIPSNAECGSWSLQILRLTDNAGNNAILQGGAPQLAGVGFLVSGENCDSTSPTLERLELSPSIVSNEVASDVLVTAELGDGSRAMAITGWVAGPVGTGGHAPRIPFSCTRSSGDPRGPWTGRIRLQPLVAKGIWKVAMVRVQDRSLTWKDYTASDPVLAQSYFEVR